MEEFIDSHYDKSWAELTRLFNDKYGTEHDRESLRSFYRTLKRKNGGEMKKHDVKHDVEVHRLRQHTKTADKKYKDILQKVAELEAELDGLKAIPEISTFEIKPKTPSGGEAVAVALASDWHIEEPVKPEVVSGLNEYNLKIAHQRAETFFRACVRLTEICGKDITIDTLVLALLGDFITGSIHDELMEGNSLSPIDALIEVESMLASGIHFILNHSKLKLIIPCHSGNHGRSTKEQRFSTEAGNSFEYWMYHHLADHFKSEKRVKFLISPSYHSYLKVYDVTLRFHHGHALRFGGGIGGLTIPVNKAIAQWNKGRWADIDCFGHWHTRLDGKNFLSNGSLIGYNAYAVSIKADFEKPSQTFFIVDAKRGKTCTWPILFHV